MDDSFIDKGMLPSIIELPKILDKRGNLSVIEGLKNIPFEIKRTYWIYDVPGEVRQKGCAYRENEELIVALSGSFDVMVDDGKEKRTYSLNRSYYGLYIPRGVWRGMGNFSTNSLALILASMPEDSNDSIDNYDQFTQVIK